MKILILILFQFGYIYISQAQKNPCPQGRQHLLTNVNLLGRENRHFSSAVVSLAQAQSMFTEVKKPKHRIPFGYVVEGCDMRALFVSQVIKDKLSANTFRVALEAEDFQELNRRTSQTQEGYVEFDRHTATAICVFNEDKNVTEPYVLDPSFFNHVVPLAEWKNGFTNDGLIPTKTYFASQYSLNPQVRRSRLHSGEVAEANELRQYHLSELDYMQKSGEKPYGVGRAAGSFEGRDFQEGVD